IRLPILARTSRTHDDSRSNCNGTHHRCPPAPALDQQFCVDCGAIGSNVQPRSKKQETCVICRKDYKKRPARDRKAMEKRGTPKQWRTILAAHSAMWRQLEY